MTGLKPRFASLFLEQFGGFNGKIKAAIKYFVQAFVDRKAYIIKFENSTTIQTGLNFN